MRTGQPHAPPADFIGSTGADASNTTMAFSTTPCSFAIKDCPTHPRVPELVDWTPSGGLAGEPPFEGVAGYRHPGQARLPRTRLEIGRASCRERVCQYV